MIVRDMEDKALRELIREIIEAEIEEFSGAAAAGGGGALPLGASPEDFYTPPKKKKKKESSLKEFVAAPMAPMLDIHDAQGEDDPLEFEAQKLVRGAYSLARGYGGSESPFGDPGSTKKAKDFLLKKTVKYP